MKIMALPELSADITTARRTRVAIKARLTRAAMDDNCNEIDRCLYAMQVINIKLQGLRMGIIKAVRKQRGES